MGTGNYNETTSKLYTDLGLMTSNQKYTKDALEFFNVITGHSVPDEYDNLITAPIYMREKIISLIENEIINAQKGGEAKICIKINSLQDKKVINKLYEASNADVKVCLIVRGICCLRPGRKNLSENIKNAKYEEIKHGKHLCNIECADEYNKTLENFIDKNYDNS